MASDFKPPLKRLKTMDSEPGMKMTAKCMDAVIDKIKQSTANLTPIISDNFSKSIPFTDVWIAVIKNPKDTSKAVLALNQKCPLKEHQHLKRVNKKKIIIAPSETINSIEGYVQENVEELVDIFEDYKVVNVPALQPKLKWQFEECNKIWPCNFHPNKYNELLFSGSYFDEKDLSMHRTFMTVAFEVFNIKGADYYENESKFQDMIDQYGATIVVDPTIKSIVAATFDKRKHHPIQHSAMVAIDNVARTQFGGSWEAETMNEFKGIEEDLYLKLKKKFPDLKFGARKFVSKRNIENADEAKDPNGPYLCTGYDIYTVKEPCVMCAMGLVHARARRVFFCYPNGIDGALMSKAKLQTISSLNHHFEVFTGF